MSMKMYYVKSHVVAQCERMRDKIMYWIDVELHEKMMKCSNEEYSILEKKENELYSKIEKLDKAKDNLICVGFNYKGYWNDIKVLNEFSNQRDILDMVL